ncbi:hypothetical protein ASE19_06760 [Nocardioides sp. Root79]|nr:hypothetical protein ASE19_06760 [Nocardioides sp. Root79]KRC71129.1 hypothetical protein ASE20_09175 [Nocardioides sp. Root240]
MVALFVLVAWVGGIVQTGGALPGKRYTEVKAQFEDVGILKPGKEVKQNGLRVGTVSDIQIVDGIAEVTLRLDGNVEVFKDASAFVGNFSALGKKYVGFDPGTAEAGPLGDSPIPVAATTSSTSLEDVLSALDPKTRAALRSAVGSLATGLTGHSKDLQVVLNASPQLLRNLKTVMRVAGSDATDIDSLLVTADRLVNRFNGRTAQIEGLVRNVDRTVQAVGVDDGRPLEETLAKLPDALDSTGKALDDLYRPLGDAEVALRKLNPGARDLGLATPDLRAFLRESPEALDKVPGVADAANPALRALDTTVEDARPLVRPLSGSLNSLATLLQPFVPYVPDVGRFFSQNDLLSGILDGDQNQHYFAAQLTGVGLFSIGGAVDPLYRAEYYPCPGTAWNKATVTNCKSGAN